MNKPTVDNRHLEVDTARFAGPDLRVATGNGTETAPCMCCDGMMLTVAGPGPEPSSKHAVLLALFHQGAGLYVQLDAERLRGLAAALMRAGDFIDQGKGKQ